MKLNTIKSKVLMNKQIIRVAFILAVIILPILITRGAYDLAFLLNLLLFIGTFIYLVVKWRQLMWILRLGLTLFLIFLVGVGYCILYVAVVDAFMNIGIL